MYALMHLYLLTGSLATNLLSGDVEASEGDEGDGPEPGDDDQLPLKTVLDPKQYGANTPAKRKVGVVSRSGAGYTKGI